MDIKRRRHYFGDMLQEEQLTRTELPEIEDAIRRKNVKDFMVANGFCVSNRCNSLT